MKLLSGRGSLQNWGDKRVKHSGFKAWDELECYELDIKERKIMRNNGKTSPGTRLSSDWSSRRCNPCFENWKLSSPLVYFSSFKKHIFNKNVIDFNSTQTWLLCKKCINCDDIYIAIYCKITTKHSKCFKIAEQKSIFLLLKIFILCNDVTLRDNNIMILYSSTNQGKPFHKIQYMRIF